MQKLPTSPRRNFLLAYGAMISGASAAALIAFAAFPTSVPAENPVYLNVCAVILLLVIARACFVLGLRRLLTVDELKCPMVWFPATAPERPFYATGAFIGIAAWIITQAESELRDCTLLVVAVSAVFFCLTATNKKDQITSLFKVGLFFLLIAFVGFLARLAIG